LVTPPYHSGVVESAGVWMPLHFAYLAGHAREAGAEVRIYDAMSQCHTHEDIGREIESFRPDIVATTAITAMEPDAREICRTAKRLNPRILTVMGNVHPTFCWRSILAEDPHVDVVVRGEGEDTFAELIGAHRNAGSIETISGIAYRKDGHPAATPPRPFSSLDSRIAAWDLIEWPQYYYRPRPEGHLAIVNSSRGCRQHCSFCSQQKFWERSWRGRDAAAFVSEIEMLRDKYDVRIAMLSDETPTVDAERWERILDLLIERRVGVELLMETRVDDILRDEAILCKYVEAGISHIYVGVESANQTILDFYQKDAKAAQSKRAIELINAHDIISETSFVLGTLGETTVSIDATLEVAKWYEPDMAFFLALTPWPYADIFPALEEHIATTDYRRYNLVEPVVKPLAMTLDEIRVALHRATGRFFRDKFERLDTLSPAKRTFMISVLKLLIERSYLGKEMRAMAGRASMPESVKKMVRELGITLPAMET
jgi:anaerobic magnesium-protoporphyrin IX monomethyl ester cyclase